MIEYFLKKSKPRRIMQVMRKSLENFSVKEKAHDTHTQNTNGPLTASSRADYQRNFGLTKCAKLGVFDEQELKLAKIDKICLQQAIEFIWTKMHKLWLLSREDSSLQFCVDQPNSYAVKEKISY